MGAGSFLFGALLSLFPGLEAVAAPLSKSLRTFWEATIAVSVFAEVGFGLAFNAPDLIQADAPNPFTWALNHGMANLLGRLCHGVISPEVTHCSFIIACSCILVSMDIGA